MGGQFDSIRISQMVWLNIALHALESTEFAIIDRTLRDQGFQNL
jgi:hypothetical protein